MNQCTARIPPLSEEQAIAVAAEHGLQPHVAKLYIFRVLLNHPRLAKEINNSLLMLFSAGKLSTRLRELIIMRLGWETGSVYEWTQHWRIALDQFGVSEQELLALRGDWRKEDVFGEPERAVLEATDETLATGTLSPETWARCREHVGGDRVCLELVASIATWRWISQLARSLEVPLEDGVAHWPPDGKAPAES